MKLYVNAKSKKQINDAIAGGAVVTGDVYRPDGTVYGMLIEALPHEAVVVRYTKKAGNSPVPAAYHVWNAHTQRLA